MCHRHVHRLTVFKRKLGQKEQEDRGLFGSEDVVERGVLDDVERRGVVVAPQVPAFVARGHGRGQLELGRGIHAPPGLPGQVQPAPGGQARGQRRPASATLQAAAALAQGDRDAPDTPVPPRRQSRSRDRHTRGLPR